jgi:hypothetical protein
LALLHVPEEAKGPPSAREQFQFRISEIYLSDLASCMIPWTDRELVRVLFASEANFKWTAKSELYKHIFPMRRAIVA